MISIRAVLSQPLLWNNARHEGGGGGECAGARTLPIRRPLLGDHNESEMNPTWKLKRAVPQPLAAIEINNRFNCSSPLRLSESSAIDIVARIPQKRSLSGFAISFTDANRNEISSNLSVELLSAWMKLNTFWIARDAQVFLLVAIYAASSLSAKANGAYTLPPREKRRFLLSLKSDSRRDKLRAIADASWQSGR